MAEEKKVEISLDLLKRILSRISELEFGMDCERGTSEDDRWNSAEDKLYQELEALVPTDQSEKP